MRRLIIAFLAVLLLVGICAAQSPYIGICELQGDITSKVGYSVPPPEKAYLLIPVIVENHGYKEFSLDPYKFKVAIDKVKYGSAYLKYSIADAGLTPLDKVTLQDGGKVFGYIGFEIPVRKTSYLLSYDLSPGRITK